MKVLSKLPSPVLAGVVKEKNKAAALAEIRNCVCGGAGMIDLHMPCLEDLSVETLREIVEGASLPVLALNYQGYSSPEAAEREEQERVGSFLMAIEAGAAGIDMQGYTFCPPAKEGFRGEDRYSFTKGNPKEVVTEEEVIAKQCGLIERAHARGVEVLLSTHPGIAMTGEQVVELALYLEQRKPDILKIVTVAQNREELLESFRAMVLLKKEVKTPVAYHAAGAAGRLSRVINPVLGGHIAFCVDRYRENSVLEQLELRSAKAALDELKKL